MELSEGWRAAIADETLRRTYPDACFDDGEWTPVTIPGQWRSTTEFVGSDGPMLYRTRFDAEVERDRAWLHFDGIFYNSDVWLDGSYVGDTEGYFAPHSFEVTEALRSRSDHALALEVACARPDDLTSKRNLTGVFQHWDCLDPDDNPGGIWRPVRVEHSGPVRVKTLRVLCPRADARRATLELAADLDAIDAGTVLVRTVVRQGQRSVDHEAEHQIAAESNAITWCVDIDEPELWWPHALGGQPLAEVTVDVFTLEAGRRTDQPSDTRAVTTALRSVSMRDFRWTLNGERLFLKGVNHGPTTQRLADATPEQVRRDISLAREANLDLVRVHAHVARPELYDQADRVGILIWQDLPLQWGYARSVRKAAVRQARAAVDLLGHHPSIVVWCGHNEPLALDTTQTSDASARAKTVRAFVRGQQLPSWNKTILDASIKRSLERADRSRPVVAHSGVLPHVGSAGTDAHTYFGWYHGEERDFPVWLRRMPRLAQFVSEFGSQAIPDSDDFIDEAHWPALDWERLARTHCLQIEPFNRYVPPSDYSTYDDWRAATQRYQATILKHHVETLRRLKYRPAGGFAAFFWADAHPSVSWSVLDHERAPKLGYHTLVAACEPVIVVAERPKAAYAPGETIALDIHVVSDRRVALVGLRTTATIAFADGSSCQQIWEGDVDADACVRVGRITATAPATDGPVTIALTTCGAGVDATNQYVAQVAVGGREGARMEP